MASYQARTGTTPHTHVGRRGVAPQARTAAATTPAQAGPIIIPVAGGKGGVGKSLLTANLAIALSELSHPTIAVDLDLGASNLHTFLGLSNEHAGVGDFLAAKSAELGDLLVETGSPQLQFLAGDGRTPFLANLAYSQKLRLIKRIQQLPAEYVLLDLGSGSSFNTLDFFRLSYRGLLVTVPELPAIMNMQVFLKHFYMRVIERSFAKNREVRACLRSLRKLPMSSPLTTMEVIRERVAEIDGDAAETVDEICRQYRPHVVFNMGEHPDEAKLANHISSGLGQVLSCQADYLGFVFREPGVRESIRQGTPLLHHHRSGRFADNIRQIATRVTKYWDMPIDNSAELLLRKTREDWAG